MSGCHGNAAVTMVTNDVVREANLHWVSHSACFTRSSAAVQILKRKGGYVVTCEECSWEM